MQHQTIDTANSIECDAGVGEFFAPMSSDLVDSLMGQYRRMRAKIDGLAATVLGNEHESAMQYFLDGNEADANRHGRFRVDRLFETKGAIAALDADFWQRALALTDVLDFMPARRRNEWHEQIQNHDTPAFEEDWVRTTLESLLSQRAEFFAERVDGIFRVLSGEHVTNRPEGFSKRMIIAGVLDDFGTVEWRKGEYINDLRAVIARFMGRDQPRSQATRKALSAIRKDPGVWHDMDGGALRMRVYKRGTCHIEVHEDMAWRLNAVLASLYPAAIPPQFRTQPKTRKKRKPVILMDRPLPFAIIQVLAEGSLRGSSLHLTSYYLEDKHVTQAVEQALMAIGGVKQNAMTFVFDYHPGAALNHIILTGCIPDQRSHQYYPTPEHIADEAVSLAEIGAGDRVLEPSAGQGHIAQRLPRERTTCVEVAELHCKVLTSQGFDPICADFIEWANTAAQFDRVVMNPPFSEGRAIQHVSAAADLVRPGGRLVAIVPASMREKPMLPDWTVRWSEVYSNEFAGTGIAVTILVADREVTKGI
ncbi:class I SAM-dependent methyltransferase [Modicisalibacter sp. MOD 31.J]|uniref:DUF4942 domain-containing protein n=1 Tax=Modicisalibacter sp. MOD 31.J TaxID=2831897 RepID=UPI001CCCD222|nr:class I SAM-dependent methyltransferase [Modicisalibacter sp. MOD 31.J]MBZ9574638.1 DUF4942 domain-containing protein [Modicisalibacter sp. MOD 31.J]